MSLAAWAGLGLYEYMLLSEELGTEPIWVINNGIRHATLGLAADRLGLHLAQTSTC